MIKAMKIVACVADLRNRSESGPQMCAGMTPCTGSGSLQKLITRNHHRCV